MPTIRKGTASAAAPAPGTAAPAPPALDQLTVQLKPVTFKGSQGGAYPNHRLVLRDSTADCVLKSGSTSDFNHAQIDDVVRCENVTVNKAWKRDAEIGPMELHYHPKLTSASPQKRKQESMRYGALPGGT